MIGLENMILGSIDIIYVIAILFSSILLSNILSAFIRKTGEKIKLARNTRKSIMWIINLVIYSLALITSLFIMGADVTALIAGLGIFALAIGFAAQHFLSNIIAGFIIILEKPFRIGDMISFENNEGWVENIGLRSTIISTYDRNNIVVPNSELINSSLVNLTGGTSKNMISVNIVLQPDVKIEDFIKHVRMIPENLSWCIVDDDHTVEIFIKPIKELGTLKYYAEVLFWVKNSKNTRDAITEFTIKMKKFFE
ncbi:mechanosensitive ion channel family protein [Candidatus Micrarchaeota archaeon]|nr:mechanosensitive ion channel family protein [Candidatus Micrarchaeota archaeon]